MSWQAEQRDAGARVGFVELRSVAEQVSCPFCGMDIGHTCLNMTTGQPLVKVPAHDHRIKKARG